MLSQNRSWFVQNQNTCMPGKRLGYLHPLAVSDRKGSDSCIDIEIAGIQRLKHCRRLLGGTAPVQSDAAQRSWHMSRKNVFRDGKLRIKAEFLIDRRNTARLSFTRTEKADRLTPDCDFAGVGRINARNDLD